MSERGHAVCAFLREAELAPGLLELCDQLYGEAVQLRSELWRVNVEAGKLAERLDVASRSKKVARKTAGIAGFR